MSYHIQSIEKYNENKYMNELFENIRQNSIKNDIKIQLNIILIEFVWYLDVNITKLLSKLDDYIDKKICICTVGSDYKIIVHPYDLTKYNIQDIKDYINLYFKNNNPGQVHNLSYQELIEKFLNKKILTLNLHHYDINNNFCLI
jgi:hypothetical protein